MSRKEKAISQCCVSTASGLGGSVAKFCLVREFARVVATSCGSEDFELLGERRVRIEGVPRLSFAHHVDHLDAGQGDSGGVRRFEIEHRPHPALDAPMILLDAVIVFRRAKLTP